MHPTKTMLAGLGLALVALAGCQSKLTHSNFELIRIDVDQKEDVSKILGKPTKDFETEWMYDDLDRHVSAIVYFHEDGRVAGKEWTDATAGTWEGRNPKAEPPPAGEVRGQKKTTRTFDD